MTPGANQTLPRLLLLAPSQNLGGGIERVVDAIESNWNGPVARVNLYSRPVIGAIGRNGRKPLFAVDAAYTAARFKPEIVLSLLVGLLPVALPVARATGAMTGLVVYGRDAWAPFGAWDRTLIRRCQRVISISDFTATWFSAMSGFPRGGVSVVKLPVDNALARQLLSHDEQSLRSHQVRGRLVTVCRLDPEVRYKGYMQVAECLPGVMSEFPDAEWVVAGDGPDRAVLEKRCQELGISDRVRILGKVSDEQLVDIYLSADAFVMPSEARAGRPVASGEGLGLVYLEAAAAAVPSIVSTEGGGSLEFVVPGVSGLAVPPNDVGAISCAVACMLREPALRDTLGVEARRRVVADHSADRFRSDLQRALIPR